MPNRGRSQAMQLKGWKAPSQPNKQRHKRLLESSILLFFIAPLIYNPVFSKFRDRGKEKRRKQRERSLIKALQFCSVFSSLLTNASSSSSLSSSASSSNGASRFVSTLHSISLLSSSDCFAVFCWNVHFCNFSSLDSHLVLVSSWTENQSLEPDWVRCHLQSCFRSIVFEVLN